MSDRITNPQGPYGWMEAFDPNFTPNLTDYSSRRYTYGNQTQAVQWNLIQLAEAFLAAGLVEEEQGAADAVNAYGRELVGTYSEW